MQFRYGAYQHASNEVTLANFQIIPVRSERGFRIATRYTMHLEGELYVDNGLTDKTACQTNLTLKIGNLINAYKDDFKDAGFYQDNGLPTPHVLPNNHPDSLTGNIVTHRNWPIGEGNEYATKRTFTVGISAMFRSAYSQIIDYHDTVQQAGDGGSIIRWYNKRFGNPGYEVITNQSFVTYQHQGFMTALSAYPIAPMPLYTRPYLLGHLTQITRTAPKRYAQGVQGYTISWSYTYVLPATGLVLPVVR
jgi:hypothetical protein